MLLKIIFPEVNGVRVLYSRINQAYLVMWCDLVLRIFNSREDAEQEYKYLIG